MEFYQTEKKKVDSFSVVYVWWNLGEKAPGKEEEEEEKKPQKWRDGQKNETDPILCIDDRLAAPGNTSPTPHWSRTKGHERDG